MPYRRSLVRSSLPAVIFIILDMLVSVVTANGVYWFRFGYFETSFNYQSLGVIHAFLVVGCSSLVGVYQSWRGRSLAFYLSSVVSSWIMSFTFLVAFLVMTKSTEAYSRLWLGTWIVSAILISLAYRVLVNAFLRYIRLQGRNSKRVLIIGSGRNYYAILGEMGLGNEWGYNLDVCLEYQNESEVLSLLKSQLEKDADFDECWLCLPTERQWRG